VNGGGDENLLREFPRHIAEQILALVECLPLDQRLAMSAVDLEGDLGTMEGLLELISSYRFGILLDLPAVELQATNFLGSIRPTSKGTNHGRLILE
jgi:hypothetical protein